MEIRINDYLYNDNDGLGKVIKIENKEKIIYKTIFLHKQLEIDDLSDYGILSCEFVTSLINSKYNIDFSFSSIKRGDEYFDDKRILGFSVENNLIKGMIEGTKIYSVFVSFSKDKRISVECTCPYSFHCKHEYAFLSFLRIYFSSNTKEIDEKIKLMNERREIDEKENLDNDKILNLIKEYKNKKIDKEFIEFASNSNEYFNDFKTNEKIKLIDKLYYLRQNIIAVYCLYLLLIHLQERNFNYDEYFKDSNDLQKRYYIEIIKKAYSSIKASYLFDIDGPLLLQIYKNDFDMILNVVKKSVYYSPLVMASINYLCDKIDVNLSNTSTLVDLKKLFKSSNDFINAIKPYLDKCNKRELRIIFKNLDKEVLDEKNLDNINDESLFKEVLKIVSPKRAIEYIVKNEKRFCDLSERDTVALIYLFNEEMNNNRSGFEVERIVNTSSLLKKYSFLFHPSNYRFIEYDVEGMDEELRDEEIDYVNNFINIFDIKYRFDYDTKSIRNKYYLFFKTFDDEIQVVKIDESDRINITSFNFVRKPNLKMLLPRYIYQTIRKMKQDEYEENERMFFNALMEAKKREIENQTMDYLDVLTNNLTSSIIPEAKVNLEYYFDYQKLNYHEDYLLYLKVGIDKMYKVQNINRFFENIQKKRYDTYGKNLGFHHNLNNFNSPHNKVLNYLVSSNFSDDSRRCINLSPFAIDYLMNVLIGENINYNREIKRIETFRGQKCQVSENVYFSYLVTLDEFEFKVFIDKDYNISFLGDNDFNILKGYEKLYILKDGFVYSITDKHKKDLIDFLVKFNGACIKKSIDKFMATLYYANSDLFILSDEIKDKFLNKEKSINLYFDYNNKDIECVMKVLDGNENEITNLNNLNEFDKTRIKIVNEFLNHLGFSNYILSSENKIYNFLRTDLKPLLEVAKVFLSDDIKNTKVIDFPKIKYRIQYENNMMSIFMQESIFSKEELKDIFSKIKKKKKYVLLKNNTIINIESEEATKFLEIVNDFKLDIKELERPKVIPIYQLLKAHAYSDNIEVDDYASKMIEEIANFKNYDLPHFKGEDILRNYQLDGVKWLTILSGYKMGGVLADDMGLGKTLQIIAMLRVNYKDAPSLIVCPKSLIFNWVNEFKKFDIDSKIQVIFGSINERKKIIENIKEDERRVYITSYDSLRNDIELYKSDFQYIILDEAQAIKNVQTLKSQSVKLLKGEVRFALTGTPIENNILDLWSIFDFVLPGYFSEISEFKDNYEHDEGYVKRIAKKVSPFILRRSKKDVLKDLPDKFERIISVDMKGEQLKLYQAYIERAKEAMESDGTFAVLQYLTRLRQICVSPKTFVDEYKGESEKIEYVNELIDNYINEGHKILLFSQFVSALKIIEVELKKKNLDYYMLTGETKAMDRIEMCNEFNESSSQKKIFLISLKAGGNGLNLTGADTVIHIDPWWNVSAENQATDRAHRIGQNKNVEVIKLICSDSIEQRVIELQNLKKDLIDKVISNDETSITKLSHEDLSFILS